MKECNKCGVTKQLSDFGRDGQRPRRSCKACVAAYAAAWRAANPQRTKEIHQRHRDKHRESRLLRDKEWIKANPERRAETRRKSREKRREADRIYAREYQRRVRQERPEVQLKSRVSNYIRMCLVGGKAGRSWESLVGYTLADLRAHLERQFVKGMGWHNMSEWHIDHIVPVASFDITGPDCAQLVRAWALTNLRPLWAKDNLRKGARIQSLL